LLKFVFGRASPVEYKRTPDDDLFYCVHFWIAAIRIAARRSTMIAKFELRALVDESFERPSGLTAGVAAAQVGDYTAAFWE
jgi:hypothetical protein